MTAIATCHCGAVRITIPALPDSATDCNCSICRRLGALWSYYPAAEVTVEGETDGYRREAPILAFHRCRRCGCATHWQGLDGRAKGRVGVNARLFDGFDPWTAPIRRLDGLNDRWD